MTGKYRQSQNKNKSRFYILLSVVFVVFMFKWGLPLFMNIIAGNGAQRVKTADDIIPPQSPVISALPDATNSARVSIEGFTEAGASVELILNDLVNKLSIADETGAFRFESSLISGQNRIQLRAKDEVGNESMSAVSVVLFDSKPIELTILSPRDGSEYFGKINQALDIKGEVSKADSQVLLNNSFVQVDRDGTFVFRLLLSDGENLITINASDVAGNTTEKTVRLFYTP